jgi:hypothetical protein
MIKVLIRKSKTLLVLLVTVQLLQVLSFARADWINLTGAETAPNIAEITVLDDRVHVALEISLGNLEIFEDLVPDDWLKTQDLGRAPLAERLARFSRQTFRVVTGDGTALDAELKLIEPRLRKDRISPFAGMINPMTRQRVPGPPADKRVAYAELEYPFAGKPNSLSFVPPSDAAGTARVNIGFIAYHKAVPIIDFRYLSSIATVKLDWQDPWYTKFDNPNLKRHHKSAQMSFLYVEPREVRHEVLVRVRDLQDWIDLGLSGGTTISAGEQAGVKERAQAFFARKNPLKVDGVEIKPVASRAEFLKVSLTGLQVIEDDTPLELSTAIIGVITSYPVKHLPKHVSVQWELFTERVQRIPATAIDPAGPLLSYVEASDPVLEWENYLLKYQEPKVTSVVLDDNRSIGVPLVSLAVLILALTAGLLAVRPRRLSRRIWIAASVLGVITAVGLDRVAVVVVPNPFLGAPDKAASTRIVTDVLNNVNHAFVEKDPSALRRALSVVVADNTLGDVEAEIGRALAIKVAGGGIARVDAIEDVSLQETAALDDRAGFRTLAQWTARASAGHWGHPHRRTIRFRALMELVNVEGEWKLAGMTVVDAKQQS